ncbi:MAG TPA: alpha/beta hydrolase [Rhodocyclaceae bacterium]
MSPKFAIAGGHRLEYEILPGRDTDRAPLVLLHEGLGSIALWRDFPQLLVAATGRSALVYSRYGYGHSDALAEARRPDYLHVEALRTLSELLDALDIARPVLVGHSDGASIALIHAGGAGRPVSGVVAMAPHVMVEEVALAGIRDTVRSFESGKLRERLASHHDDVDGAFRGWSDTWLDPAFRAWNIEEYLPRIAAPILAVQGEDDEYATMAQIDRIAAQASDVEVLKLADCRHSPHRDQPAALVDAIATFVGQLR